MTALCRSDAAYVLGALSPADRRDFEDHLRECAACQASVQRLAGLPGLLALTSADDVEQVGDPVPDSLLPGLIARVAASRRRRHWVMAGALAASIAVLIALVGTVLVRAPAETAAPSTTVGTTAGSAPTSAPVILQPMTQVLAGPMTASLELVDKRWGTAITVVCHYDEYVDSSVSYDLAVIDTDGNLNPAGTWRAVPGVTARVATATAVPRDRIAALEVRLSGGQTILRSGP